MPNLDALKARLRAGTVGAEEVVVLRGTLLARTLTRDDVGFLVELRARAESAARAQFEEVLFAAVERVVLIGECIDADAARWLRQVLFAGGRAGEREKRLLWELHTRARQISPEFQKLFDDCAFG